MKEEKYIKDTLANYDSPMDMDAMWADLEKSLDNDKDEKPVFWLFRFGKKLFFTSLALMLTVAAFTFYSINKPNELKIPQTTTELSKTTNDLSTENTPATSTVIKNKDEGLTQQQTQESKIESKTNSEKTPVTRNIRAKETIDAKSINIERKVNQKQLSSNTNTVETAKTKTSFSRIIPSQTKSQDTQKPISKTKTDPNQNSIKAIDAEQAIPAKQQTTNKKPIVIKKEAETSKTLNNYLSSLAFLSNQKLLQFSRKLPSLSLKFSTPTPKRIRVKQEPNKWRAKLAVAQSTSYFIHKNPDGLSLFNDFNRPDIAATNNLGFGISLSRKTKGSLLFTTGLNYLKHGAMYSEYRITESEERSTREIIYVDPQFNFLGSAEEEIETANLNIRSYREYKRLHSLQLPLSIGYEIGFKKLDLSISVGPALNYFFSQSASTTEETDAFLNYRLSAIRFSALLSAELGYSFSDRYRLFTSVDGGRILSRLESNSLESDFPNFTNLSYTSFKVGLSYDF